MDREDSLEKPDCVDVVKTIVICRLIGTILSLVNVESLIMLYMYMQLITHVRHIVLQQYY